MKIKCVCCDVIREVDKELLEHPYHMPPCMCGSRSYDVIVEKTKEYRVARGGANGIHSLENSVNRLLEEGWELVGGVSITGRGVNNNDLELVQAMVRVK